MIGNCHYGVHESRTPALTRGAQGPRFPRLARLRDWLRAAARRRRLRARLRRDLERLDERLCRDIGVPRHELQREAVKPFWRP